MKKKLARSQLVAHLLLIYFYFVDYLKDTNFLNLLRT